MSEGSFTLQLSVNGQAVERVADPRDSLLRFLRDDLNLCGTKDGCSTGDCGSCLVLVNGKPELSCLMKVRRAHGSEVETIENLAAPGRLHPLQAAFLETGGVQCGFCIPGMILAAKAVLEAHPQPSAEEIREGLKDVVCRCTGYTQIFEAVELAAHWQAHPDEYAQWQPRSGALGVSASLVDGAEAVTGTLKYIDDLSRAGMLYGKGVWSAHPYARIVKVDTKAASQSPGVVRIFTAKDVPGLNAHGRTRPDQPVFCHDFVRFTGDMIALVVARTRRQAEEAAAKVEVEYEPLSGIHHPQDSLAEAAPRLHPDGNTCKRLLHQTGDVQQAFAEAAAVAEGHFETQRVDHAYLEPLGVLAEMQPDGVLAIYGPQQAPFETREQLAAVLGMPRDKVRVVVTPLGGGFGGKLEIHAEAAAAVAAYHLRKPIKMILTREENLHTGVKRHPYWMDYRVGVDAQGSLLAVEATLLSDAGPYTGNSPRVIDQACIFSCGPYRVPNLRIEGISVFTNNANNGAFRGYGINQAAVAMEQLLDELALKVGLDPFELRRRNMLQEGDCTITGQYLASSVGALPSLDACEQAFNEEWPQWKERARPGYKIGYGVASAYKNVGAGKGKPDDAGATFTLLPNGRVQLIASVVDMGQAIRTTMVQLAGQSTGIDTRRFDLISGDTAQTHPHRSASGERQTLIAGNAVVMAGKDFRKKILDAASRWSGIAAGELNIVGGEIRTIWSQYTQEETVMTLETAADRAAQEQLVFRADAVYMAPKTYPLSDQEARKRVPKEEYRNYPTYAYATQVAIVEVEEATGKVEVLRVIAAHDVGVAINPQQIRGQLLGSIVMMQGYTLSENYVQVDGRPPWRHVTYGRLGVPRSTDTPSMRIEIVEDPFPEGPFGAKGISEIATVPPPPAILNAIYNATGVRLRKVPVDREVLRAAIAERKRGQA